MPVCLEGVEEVMARLGAEMRHVDLRHGVAGQKPRGPARGEACEAFLQAQDGQGAFQPDRVDLDIAVHGAGYVARRRGSTGM
jgi:hypothetical protein